MTAESPTGSTTAARTRGTRLIMGYMIASGPARHLGCGKRRSSKIRAGGRHGARGGAALTQRLAERS